MGIQEKLEMIGKYGCYFLCLLKATNQLDNRHIIDFYDEMYKEGLIDNECTIMKPTQIARKLTGRLWSVKKSDTIDKSADIIIAKWHNKRTGLSHFTLMSRDNIIVFDPLGDSVTVREGMIESYRLYYCLSK